MQRFPKLYAVMSDKLYLKLKFRVKMKKSLHLKNPQTFNEKLQWLKLHDRKPIYTTMVDKYEVKKYVAEKIGEEYIIPTLGVWDNFDDIDFDKLPDQFVLKCTHDSGGLVICKDKSKLDFSAARKKINRSLKNDYYLYGREWPYKDVKPRIIAEEYMEDNTLHELRDYKFFCFGGQVECYKVDFDRFIEHHANYYDRDGNLLEFGEVVCPPVYDRKIERPKTLPKMIEFAEKLSNEIPFLRADFYDVNGQVYFGELTFFPASGIGEFVPKEWDLKLGEWIHIPRNNGGYYLLISHDYIVLLRCAQETGLKDYKVYCFNGEPKFTLVCSERFTKSGLKEDSYDLNWNPLVMRWKSHDNAQVQTPKPRNYDLLLDFSEKLSSGTPFLRCDFYEASGKLYFGELTFFPTSGFEGFQPESWDKTLGDWLDLSGL